MRHQIRLICALGAWLLSLIWVQARPLGGRASISLLTCAPGEEIYSKFGHTAIRVCDPDQDLDDVYNYGLFSFYADNFVIHFVKGETDYQLGADDTEDFVSDYAREGRHISWQRLRLDSAQRNRIYAALLENARPENRVYRYNFVFDNCATRPYELICQALGATPAAPHAPAETYREAIARYFGHNSWNKLGTDLLLGMGTDAVMTDRQRLFLPEELMNHLGRATLDGLPLVEQSQTMPFDPPKPFPWPLTPQALMAALILLTLAASWADIRHGRARRWLDMALCLTLGLIGCVIVLLWGWSEHPFVQDNMNILLFNPLMLVAFAMMTTRRGRRLTERTAPWWGACCVAAVAAYVLSPQTLHPLSLCAGVMLCTRAICFMWLRRHDAPSQPQKTKSRRKVLLTALLLTATLMQAETRLVVVATVDGLDMPSLDRLSSRMGEGGLTRLMRDGRTYSAVYFPHHVNGGAETTATLLTGTTPTTHGYAADYTYDRRTRRAVPTLTDITQTGIGTDESLSPAALLSPTLTDAMRFADSRARIYAIGISGNDAILLAGHQANAAVWLDDREQKWVAAGYYTEGLPTPAAEMNRSDTLRALASAFWRPAKPVADYLNPSPRELTDGGFAYNPLLSLRNGREAPALTRTPAVNELIAELALQLQAYRHLGQEERTDALMLQLTVVTPAAQSDYVASAEQEDMYCRLNLTLGRLIGELEQRIGRGKVLVVLCGKPAQGRRVETLQRAHISAGHFNPTRAAALVNTYLMALHGQETWVVGGYGNQIFLNRQAIEQRKLKLEDMQDEVAHFMLEFEGVAAAYAAHSLPSLTIGRDEPEATRLRNSYNKRGGGDVIIRLQTGWNIVDEAGHAVDRVPEQNPQVPVILMDGATTPQRIDDNLPATFLTGWLSQRLMLPRM